MHRRHPVRIGIKAVVALAGISAQVVQLAGVGGSRDPLGREIPRWNLRNPTGRRVDENPVVLPQGVAVGVGVVDELAAR